MTPNVNLVDNAEPPGEKAKNSGGNVENASTTSCKQATQKSLLVAYLLWFPMGLFGFHRLYLGHRFMGFCYMFSLGYYFTGWIVDGFCMPSIVKETNEWLKYDAENPLKDLYRSCGEVAMRYNIGDYGRTHLARRSLRDARILAIHPIGIMGVHRQYLGRPWYRLTYNLTAGHFLVGWITDMFRIPSLVKQYNAEIDLLRSGVTLTEMKRQDIWDCKLFDAYVCGIMTGIFGGHHFYLGRYKWGFLYLFTLGLLGIGVVYDVVRMKSLVEETNRERKMTTTSAAMTSIA